MKKIVSIIAIVTLLAGWLMIAWSFLGTVISFHSNVSLAEQSINDGLYEQGVEYYNKALSLREDKELYKRIKDTYLDFYKEQKNDYSYNRYLESLEKCCNVFAYDGNLWEELVSRYFEGKKYKEANEAIKKAEKNNVITEKTLELKKEISHMYQVSFLNVKEYTIGKNNTYSVTDGNVYWNMDFYGETLGLEYKYVGPLDESGKAVFIDNAGSNIRDYHEITRIKLKTNIGKSGYFNSGVVPVETDGQWIYLDENGNDAEIGTFDYAASMCEGTGAVKKQDVWSIVNTSGDDSNRGKYSVIELDQYGCHTDGDYYIGATDGEFSVYDFNGNKLVGLDNVADIDIGEFGDLFAYKDKKTGLWGYMNKSGESVIQPKYSNAKGFSNGYAAVCNSEGLWGIIEEDATEVTDYEFYYVGYFTPEYTCMVSRTEGAMGVFSFAY
ncbi:WG repeat-containing protein [Ruminococcus sp. JE7B6]|uniref:WG repeat-containing protein n=1 Tax=Ruminococcus sp. JE7B6 TaxID=3233380 RepID=UPI00389A4AC4